MFSSGMRVASPRPRPRGPRASRRAGASQLLARALAALVASSRVLAALRRRLGALGGRREPIDHGGSAASRPGAAGGLALAALRSGRGSSRSSRRSSTRSLGALLARPPRARCAPCSPPASTRSRTMDSTSRPDVAHLGELADASTLTKGAPASRARRRAISVFPTPVGPIMMMLLGRISSRSSSSTCWRRQRLRSAMATAFLASFCPTMYLSSSATICARRELLEPGLLLRRRRRLPGSGDARLGPPASGSSGADVVGHRSRRADPLLGTSSPAVPCVIRPSMPSRSAPAR